MGHGFEGPYREIERPWFSSVKGRTQQSSASLITMVVKKCLMYQYYAGCKQIYPSVITLKSYQQQLTMKTKQ